MINLFRRQGSSCFLSRKNLNIGRGERERGGGGRGGEEGRVACIAGWVARVGVVGGGGEGVVLAGGVDEDRKVGGFARK